jgi:nitrile hydratase subunit beta
MGAGERRPAVGDEVRVSADDPDEFRRVPGYLRGQVGVVVAECGEKPLPVGFGAGEVNRPPEPVLTVRFDAGQVFGPTGVGSYLHADLWVSNLEAVR